MKTFKDLIEAPKSPEKQSTEPWVKALEDVWMEIRDQKRRIEGLETPGRPFDRSTQQDILKKIQSVMNVVDKTKRKLEKEGLI